MRTFGKVLSIVTVLIAAGASGAQEKPPAENKLAVLERFARERGRPLRELALAWLAAQPAVSSVLAGATRPEQVEENVRAFDWRLAAADLAELDAALGDITPPGPPGDE